MDRRISKTIERPTGTGEVRKQGQYVATVRYALTVTQEYFVDARTGDKIEGLTSTEGSITEVKGGSVEVGETLTLHLQDGRHADFFVTHADWAGPRQITVSGGIQGK